MNERLRTMRERLRCGGHKANRRGPVANLTEECDAEGLSWMQRIARLTVRQCQSEQPVIEPDEQIAFARTVPNVPEIYSRQDFASLTAGRKLHESGPVNNITPDWPALLSQGLLGRREIAVATRAGTADAASREFLDAAIESIDATLELASRYAQHARNTGRDDLAEILARVPALPARTFHEALQSIRLAHAIPWMIGHYQIGLGRFDQYAWPLLDADLRAGRLTVAAAEELLAEFFMSLNKDSDLYPGVQQGDNGQTLMLGGVRPDGSDGVNELTRMCLRAMLDVAMIDPKINLRIDRNTDPALLELATRLTRKGLGFPQYSNDDVVIPALVECGYELADARDYTVAACWEFIIPGKGMEIVNIGAVSLPHAADAAIRSGLAAGDDFDGILRRVDADIDRQTRELVDSYRTVLLPPAPYLSVLMDDCLTAGRDISMGGKYNNFGVHGACPANAADSLAAVRKLVFQDKTISPAKLLQALDANFDGFEDIQFSLSQLAPKVGNDDDTADDLMAKIYDYFGDACRRIADNSRGGKVRPGTGSAMYYIWLADERFAADCPTTAATADGRCAGKPFGANLAPSPGASVMGPMSVLKSFSKIDYRKICNGGPITLELSESIFRDEQAVKQVAQLVRTFARLGCQQLQINTVSRERLIEARRNPAAHRDLVVRVWGWSGYFHELSAEYQDQIIARHAFE